MASIHFIERQKAMVCIDKEKAEWESGKWAVSEETAQKLVGGDIYFHLAQDKPSYFGGKIVSFRVLPDTEEDCPGRIVFRFSAGMQFKDVRAGNDGWSMEKKIVWSESDR